MSVELRIGLHNMLLSRHMPSNYLVTYQSITWVADAIHRHRYGCPSAVVAPCAQLTESPPVISGQIGAETVPPNLPNDSPVPR